MENNLYQNLFLQQFNESNSIAYNESFVSSSSDYNFQLLDNAYRNAGKIYAKLKIAIETNNCMSEDCALELTGIKNLEESPQASLDFLSSLIAELSVTEESNFDPNNNYKYTVANSLMSGRPGFSKTDGYNAYLDLLPDGSQQVVFIGPALKEPLVINSSALTALTRSDTSLIASTPDINKDMLRLLTEVGLFSPDMIGENKELTASAKITEEYVMMNPDGSFDYEIIDLGDGKGRNVLKYDLEKIEKKVSPFINAEVSGLMSSEQDVIAAWNVYISKDTSVEEDAQMAQNANAGASSWSYEEDLPLQQDKKVLFEIKYKEYFMNNYLKQFTTNQLPTVKEDAAVFDLAEAKKAKAQKFLDDNNLN
ncbi:MAG: hypothetical protein N2B06_19275 [Clostridium sp.]|tara:strand:+ start:1054 stop:2151 length:1098 start_codon:yes stop_codon:yes gene_type:complete